MVMVCRVRPYSVVYSSIITTDVVCWQIYYVFCWVFAQLGHWLGRASIRSSYLGNAVESCANARLSAVLFYTHL